MKGEGMIRFPKKLLGKTVEIAWNDPTTVCRADPLTVNFTECQSLGKVVFISKEKIILRHEVCGELVDETIIHPVLVTKINIIKN